MKIFGYGEDTKQWMSTLDKWSVSYVLQNGHTVDPVTLRRGCTQSGPVWPYILVIVADISSEYIWNSQNINQLKIVAIEQKIWQYADDTIIFIAT